MVSGVIIWSSLLENTERRSFEQCSVSSCHVSHKSCRHGYIVASRCRGEGGGDDMVLCFLIGKLMDV